MHVRFWHVEGEGLSPTYLSVLYFDIHYAWLCGRSSYFFISGLENQLLYITADSPPNCCHQISVLCCLPTHLYSSRYWLDVVQNQSAKRLFINKSDNIFFINYKDMIW